MKRKLIALILCAMLIATMMPVPALAVGDTTPPELISVVLSDTDIATYESLMLFIKAKDDVSGLYHSCSVGISSVGSTEPLALYTGVLSSEQPDTYVMRSCIDESVTKSGDCYISSITLWDEVSNSKLYSVADGTLPGSYRFHFSNTVKTDWDPPALVSLRIDKKSYKVGETLKFSLYAKDISKITECRLTFYSEHSWTQAAEITEVVGKPGYYTGTYTVPSYLPEDWYRVCCVYLSDEHSNTEYYYVEDKLPVSMECPFQTLNPAVKPNTSYPVVTGFSMPNSVLQGDKIRISVTVDPKGRSLKDDCHVYARYTSGSTVHEMEIILGQKDRNNFYVDLMLPVNWTPGTLWVSNRFSLQDIYGNCISASMPASYYDEMGNYVGPSHNCSVASAFSGTNNISVALGSDFDPLQGVSAKNSSEGDMTASIECNSTVDISKVGLYLVKYKIKSGLSSPYGMNDYYYDFRWVGVSAVQPNPSICDPGTLVIAGGNVNIDTNGSSALLTRDGVAVSLASSVSSPGKYTVTLSDGSSKSGKFTISRLSPAISASFQGSYPSKLTVAVKCSDPTGIAETRWMAGNVSLDTIRAQGQAFRNTFVTNRFGDYTVYARNKLGNETVKKVTLQYTAVSGVSVSTPSTKLAVGQTCQLAPILAPSNCTFPNVIWSSSNPSIARVDASGLVEALSPGIVKIMVRTRDGGKTSFCVVNVMAPPDVVSVVINSADKTVSLGNVFKLTATVSPSGAADTTILWSSSNNRVVAVGVAGTFRAIGVGTATIYARARNGVYAVCKITVTPQPGQTIP